MHEKNNNYSIWLYSAELILHGKSSCMWARGYSLRQFSKDHHLCDTTSIVIAANTSLIYVYQLLWHVFASTVCTSYLTNERYWRLMVLANFTEYHRALYFIDIYRMRGYYIVLLCSCLSRIWGCYLKGLFGIHKVCSTVLPRSGELLTH